MNTENVKLVEYRVADTLTHKDWRALPREFVPGYYRDGKRYSQGFRSHLNNNPRYQIVRAGGGDFGEFCTLTAESVARAAKLSMHYFSTYADLRAYVRSEYPRARAFNPPSNPSGNGLWIRALGQREYVFASGADIISLELYVTASA